MHTVQEKCTRPPKSSQINKMTETSTPDPKETLTDWVFRSHKPTASISVQNKGAKCKAHLTHTHMQTRAARPTCKQRTFCSCLMITNSLSEGQTGLWNTTFTLALFNICECMCKLRTIYIRGFCMMHLRSSLAQQCMFNELKREHTVQEGKTMFFSS